MRLKKRRERSGAIGVVTGILLTVYTVGLLAPMLWALITSFTEVNSYFDFYVDKMIFANGPAFRMTLENYQVAEKFMNVTTTTTSVTYNIVGLYIHSLMYALICAGTWVAVTLVVSYLVARFDFKFSKILYHFVLITMCIPIVGALASELRMLQTLGIYDTWISMAVLKFNFLGVYFLTFVAMFKAIPKEYTEAAKIDGASNLYIMLKVIFPQALNMTVTVFLLNFITYWNDYKTAMLYLPSYPVATYGVYYFMNTPMGSGATSQVPVQVAGAILMTLPILIVFIVFNKRLRGGVYVGGIKG
ncbi:MAG: carbohydrate ABC transporter permease [Oscillospiraceae bacterium]|nr:carbohydrate ABC transporter permease [Oscillospiraceae bacterium]